MWKWEGCWHSDATHLPQLPWWWAPGYNTARLTVSSPLHPSLFPLESSVTQASVTDCLQALRASPAGTWGHISVFSTRVPITKINVMTWAPVLLIPHFEAMWRAWWWIVPHYPEPPLLSFQVLHLRAWFAIKDTQGNCCSHHLLIITATSQHPRYIKPYKKIKQRGSSSLSVIFCIHGNSNLIPT